VKKAIQHSPQRHRCGAPCTDSALSPDINRNGQFKAFRKIRNRTESAVPRTFCTPLSENSIPRVLEGVFRLLLWFKLLESFPHQARN
jgi:hypothetical protein